MACPGGFGIPWSRRALVAFGMIDTSAIRDRFVALSPHLDERGRRSFAAAEARSAGYGGIAAVARATAIAPSTIGRGLEELAGASDVPTNRNRRAGGGRKTLTQTNPARHCCKAWSRAREGDY